MGVLTLEVEIADDPSSEDLAFLAGYASSSLQAALSQVADLRVAEIRADY